MKAMFNRIIAVPIESEDVDKTLSKLPRHPDEAKICAVKLKKMLELKSAYLEEYIRPAKVDFVKQ